MSQFIQCDVFDTINLVVVGKGYIEVKDGQDLNERVKFFRSEWKRIKGGDIVATNLTNVGE